MKKEILSSSQGIECSTLYCIWNSSKLARPMKKRIKICDVQNHRITRFWWMGFMGWTKSLLLLYISIKKKKKKKRSVSDAFLYLHRYRWLTVAYVPCECSENVIIKFPMWRVWISNFLFSYKKPIPIHWTIVLRCALCSRCSGAAHVGFLLTAFCRFRKTSSKNYKNHHPSEYVDCVQIFLGPQIHVYHWRLFDAHSLDYAFRWVKFFRFIINYHFIISAPGWTSRKKKFLIVRWTLRNHKKYRMS